ncbi:hypothetical protein [Novosphingobium colocasiae]|uniref:hypothetical protein n=1 Tax=Novosphingobium colocasiae TaxID=1256513 RepID=UPI0035B4E4A5
MRIAAVYGATALATTATDTSKRDGSSFSDSGTRISDWKISIKSVDINLSMGFAHRPRLLMLVSLLRETNR